MRRILFFIAAAFMLSSCFDMETTSSRTYQLVATFEYSTAVVEDTFGQDSLCFEKKYGEGIGYDNLGFYHKLNAGKTMVDGGFLLSRFIMPASKNTENLTNNEYRAYVIDKAAGLKNTYLVFKQNPDKNLMPEHSMVFAASDFGTCTMTGCYVTNTVEVMEAVSETFELGDRLTLRATGYLDGKKSKSAEFLLADFSAQKDSIVSRWTGFDLSDLGSVEYVDFELESTKPSIPMNFCLDNVIASVDISY